MHILQKQEESFPNKMSSQVFNSHVYSIVLCVSFPGLEAGRYGTGWTGIPALPWYTATSFMRQLQKNTFNMQYQIYSHTGLYCTTLALIFSLQALIIDEYETLCTQLS